MPSEKTYSSPPSKTSLQGLVISIHAVKLYHIDRKYLYQELYGPRTLNCWNTHHGIPLVVPHLLGLLQLCAIRSADRT